MLFTFKLPIAVNLQSIAIQRGNAASLMGTLPAGSVAKDFFMP